MRRIFVFLKRIKIISVYKNVEAVEFSTILHAKSIKIVYSYKLENFKKRKKTIFEKSANFQLKNKNVPLNSESCIFE
jgi:hypothetical protein